MPEAPVRRGGSSAEEVGFEPTVGCPTHDFQSCRFGRSRTPPRVQPGQANGRGSHEPAGGELQVHRRHSKATSLAALAPLYDRMQPRFTFMSPKIMGSL